MSKIYDVEIHRYDCGYCREVFEIGVRSVGTGHKGGGSTVVQCPKCKNFLKTWTDGKYIRDDKWKVKR